MSEVLQLALDLLQRPSITPNDCDCQKVISEYLNPLGFTTTPLNFEDTHNLWARRSDKTPLFCFVGHTDVVPPGDLNLWQSPPFTPTIKDGFLFARGAADMKSSIAAMMVAVKRFVTNHPNHNGSIAFLITSDEEGDFINGTTKVVDVLEARNEKITWALVGEPTAAVTVGDTIKNGRRGSLTGTLTINGVQGHVAYPDLAVNPIHKAAPIIDELQSMFWDNGNESFPATSLQIVDIHSGNGITNVIPSKMKIIFNLRFSTQFTSTQIIERITNMVDAYNVDYNLSWSLSGEAFLTKNGRLITETQAAIKKVTGQNAAINTAGGTSDGRFIAPTGAEVLELGPVNASIHKVNECVNIKELETLVEIYYQTLENLLC